MTLLPTALRRITLGLAATLTLALAAPAAADDAPFGPWLALEGNSSSGGAGHGYVQIPHDPSLNPTSGLTIELWVKLDLPFTGFEGCRSLVGKDWTQAYWVGVCGSTLRSYTRGAGSAVQGGTVPDDVWTHIAVTSDGLTRRHFINGVQVAASVEGGPPTSSTAPVRIGSDVSHEFSPAGEIDEVRIWRIALTADEIQIAKRGPILAPQPGLVAAWSFDVTFDDAAGPHHGSGHGERVFFIFAPPAGAWITVPGLPGYRFKARINGTTTGTQVFDCVPETVCIAGAIPSRTEIFIRVIGPRPNGFMWAQVVKFTPARVEVWIEQLGTGTLRYYEVASVPADSAVIPGIVDKTAFLPLP